jgi:hypothetical protein
MPASVHSRCAPRETIPRCRGDGPQGQARSYAGTAQYPCAGSLGDSPPAAPSTTPLAGPPGPAGTCLTRRLSTECQIDRSARVKPFVGRTCPLPGPGPCSTSPPRPDVGAREERGKRLPYRLQTAMTALTSAQSRAVPGPPARGEHVRDRCDAEEGGPKGRPENAMLSSEICNLPRSEQKQRMGQGCGQGTQATGLINNSNEERKQTGSECRQCCFFQCTAADTRYGAVYTAPVGWAGISKVHGPGATCSDESGVVPPGPSQIPDESLYRAARPPASRPTPRPGWDYLSPAPGRPDHLPFPSVPLQLQRLPASPPQADRAEVTCCTVSENGWRSRHRVDCR